MLNKENYVAHLDMAEVVKQHRVFEVFVEVANVYPNSARALFDKYVDFIRNNNESVRRVAESQKQERAEYIANQNIGYFIGNCDDFETRKFLFNTYPTTYHPVLGREF